MPIAILPKTTIRDVLTQALKDSQKHSHEPLCLHLEPGRQLEFYPAAGSTATDATDVKNALIDAIANGLADGPQVWKDFDEKTLKIYARALLESVLTDSDVSTVAQLTRLVKSTTKLRIAGDSSVAADDEVRTIMSIAAMISHPEWQTAEGLVKGALDDLAYFSR